MFAFLILSSVLYISCRGTCEEKPLNVVIIGAGPAGLGLAIEAKENGANVSLIEKRNAYTRPRWTVLTHPSILQLQKWEINLPELRKTDAGQIGTIGIIPIKYLEEGLFSKVKTLGIKIIYGEFKKVNSDKSVRILTPNKEEINLSYDILVGADGAHSLVKESLNIDTKKIAEAYGAAVLIHKNLGYLEVPPPSKVNGFFVRKFAMPTETLFSVEGDHPISKEELKNVFEASGWNDGADWVAHDGIVMDDIHVVYQQAKTFSNEGKSAIIIGDAAATASFFQGLGANTAFKGVEIASIFLKNCQNSPQTAYQVFNEEMKKATDHLLEDSRFLFEQNTEVKVPHVVIVGAGPVGLATAIEAHENGFHVSLVEKRNAYSRIRWLFLIDPTIKLLKKWNVTIPQLKITDAGPTGNIGLVPIKNLEEGLLSRVNQLGISIINGEFKKLNEDLSITVSQQNKDIKISYDILVAADGSHSDVRKALEIQTNVLGTAKGAALLIHTNIFNLEAPPPIQENGLFLRRLALPMETIFSLQGDHEITKEELFKALNAAGWGKEADVKTHEGIIIESINVILQQAKTFSDQKKSAIILGDAAATGSFFQGLGANTALMTTQAASTFFKNIRKSPDQAYQIFNETMKQVTDALISDSQFLFASKNSSSIK